MDKKRKHIGLFYTKNYDSATSLVIYIQNIIKGFKLLPDIDQPRITLLYNKESSIDELKAIDYPYITYFEMKFYKLPIYKRLTNKIYRGVFNKNIFASHSFSGLAFDAVYPVWFDVSNVKSNKIFYWCIDFIQIHYPQFFTKNELEAFDCQIKEVAKKYKDIVFSSNDAYQDFLSMIPSYKGNIHLLRFPSIFELHELNKHELLLKYNLKDNYFITPNQFWPHKNHIIILKAAKLLIDKGITDFSIAFTGKLSSYRDKNYAATLQDYIKQHGLENHVKFLGFIPRQDQLNLMKRATAIIQPSLFEGWSTLVEEAKALDQYIILSDIPLHREQISIGCDFFKTDDENQLHELMVKSFDRTSEISHHYTERLNSFALDLKNIFLAD